MSRADYWYLGCKVAAEWASGWKVQLDYGWGRTDCNLAQPYWPDRIPAANSGIRGVGDHLVTRLGLAGTNPSHFLDATVGKQPTENTPATQAVGTLLNQIRSIPAFIGKC